MGTQRQAGASQRDVSAAAPSPPLNRRAWFHLAIVMTAAAAVYVTHSVLRFRNFEPKGYDLGIFDQAVRQYALFNAPIVPIKGVDFHLLGDHFHPILALLAPFYWIWDDPRMLGIVMAIALASCAIPVYLFTRRRASHTASLLAAIALLAWWPFQAMVNWEFHEVTLGVPVMAWVVWAIDARRHWLAAGLSLILLTVREDMGVTLIAIALVLALRRAWGPAVLLVVAGALGYYLATEIVIPHYSPDGEFGYWQFTALGPDMGSSLMFMITNPFDAIGVLFDHPLKVGLWLLHFVPLWLLPFLSPYTLMAAPLLLSRLFNDRLNLWAPVYQYDAIISVIFLLAAIDGLGRVTGWWARRESTRRRMVTIFTASVVGCTVVGTAFFPQVFPFHRVVSGELWTKTEKAEAFERAVDLIPDNVCIEAADNAVPHLVDRTYVSLHGVIGDDLATWMIVDTDVEELGGWDPLTPDEALERAEDLGFEVVTEDDHGLWVLHRDTPVETTCSSYVSRD